MRIYLRDAGVIDRRMATNDDTNHWSDLSNFVHVSLINYGCNIKDFDDHIKRWAEEE